MAVDENGHNETCRRATFHHDGVIKWKHFPRYWPFFRVFIGHRWIPLTKASDAELWRILWSAPEAIVANGGNGGCQIDHYADVIMIEMASQITSLTVVYSIVHSGADQSKHQSSASLAFVWGIHRDRWIPRTKGQWRGKCFHLMTSSWMLPCKVKILLWRPFT